MRSWTVRLRGLGGGMLVAAALMVVAACSDDRPTAPGADGSVADQGQRLDKTPPKPDRGPAHGSLGGPCYPNNTCNSGLRCKGGKCVPIEPDIGLSPDRGHDGPVVKPDGPAVKPDGPVVKPDGPVVKNDVGVTPPPDQGIKPDQGTVSCSPPGFKAVTQRVNTGGDWTLMHDPGFTYTNLSFTPATAKLAASVLDYNQSWQQVGGFVVSKPSVGTPLTTEVKNAVSAIGSGLYATVSTLSSGTSGTTHDGFSAVTLVELSITATSNTDVSLVRKGVVEALAGTTATGWPKGFGAANTAFVLRFAAILRKDGRVIFTGAVTDAASDKDPTKISRMLVSDLADGTTLAAANKTTAQKCDKQTLTQAATPVDIIWVMDESGSMQTKRTNIAANAATFFSQAKSAGLDFRMGVTNVCSPNGSFKSAVGKFCSSISANASDMGGTDRFLLPSEQSIFSACILNPPGYEGGSEWGLENAKEAVKRHLPRAANTPGKIRTNAQVVIIVVTDEVDNSMTSILAGQHNTCTLSATVQSAVDTYVSPYISYLQGLTDSEATIDYFQVIGGICQNTCSAQVAHGYKELAAKFKGKVYDVCAKDLTTNIKKIIADIKASSSPVTLAATPVSASLSVALDGKTLSRSRLNGFDFLPGYNSLSFHGTAAPKKGSTVVASYLVWP